MFGKVIAVICVVGVCLLVEADSKRPPKYPTSYSTLTADVRPKGAKNIKHLEHYDNDEEDDEEESHEVTKHQPIYHDEKPTSDDDEDDSEVVQRKRKPTESKLVQLQADEKEKAVVTPKTVPKLMFGPDGSIHYYTKNGNHQHAHHHYFHEDSEEMPSLSDGENQEEDARHSSEHRDTSKGHAKSKYKESFLSSDSPSKFSHNFGNSGNFDSFPSFPKETSKFPKTPPKKHKFTLEDGIRGSAFKEIVKSPLTKNKFKFEESGLSKGNSQSGKHKYHFDSDLYNDGPKTVGTSSFKSKAKDGDDYKKDSLPDYFKRKPKYEEILSTHDHKKQPKDIFRNEEFPLKEFKIPHKHHHHHHHGHEPDEDLLGAHKSTFSGPPKRPLKFEDSWSSNGQADGLKLSLQSNKHDYVSKGHKGVLHTKPSNLFKPANEPSQNDEKPFQAPQKIKKFNLEDAYTPSEDHKEGPTTGKPKLSFDDTHPHPFHDKPKPKYNFDSKAKLNFESSFPLFSTQKPKLLSFESSPTSKLKFDYETAYPKLTTSKPKLLDYSFPHYTTSRSKLFPETFHSTTSKPRFDYEKESDVYKTLSSLKHDHEVETKSSPGLHDNVPNVWEENGENEIPSQLQPKKKKRCHRKKGKKHSKHDAGANDEDENAHEGFLSKFPSLSRDYKLIKPKSREEHKKPEEKHIIYFNNEKEDRVRKSVAKSPTPINNQDSTFGEIGGNVPKVVENIFEPEWELDQEPSQAHQKTFSKDSSKTAQKSHTFFYNSPSFNVQFDDANKRRTNSRKPSYKNVEEK